MTDFGTVRPLIEAVNKMGIWLIQASTDYTSTGKIYRSCDSRSGIAQSLPWKPKRYYHMSSHKPWANEEFSRLFWLWGEQSLYGFVWMAVLFLYKVCDNLTLWFITIDVDLSKFWHEYTWCVGYAFGKWENEWYSSYQGKFHDLPLEMVSVACRLSHGFGVDY